MLKQIQFKSGVVFGSGLTFQLDKFQKNGVSYMDTPGLSDISKRKQAAAAITKALREEGHFRVFFVLRLDSGRLKPDDISLIKLVLESASDLTSYSLILNQVTKAVKRKLTGEQEIYKKLIEGGIPDDQLPKGVHIVDKDDEIEDEDDRMLSNADDLLNFVENAIPVEIYPRNVEDLRIESFDQLREELELLMNERYEIEQKNIRLEEEQKKLKEDINLERHRNDQKFKAMESEQAKLMDEVAMERQRYTDLANSLQEVQKEMSEKEEENEKLHFEMKQKNMRYDTDIQNFKLKQEEDRIKAEAEMQKLDKDLKLKLESLSSMEKEQEKLKGTIDEERQLRVDMTRKQIREKQKEKKEFEQALKHRDEKYANELRDLNLQRERDQNVQKNQIFNCGGFNINTMSVLVSFSL